ncbi:hypothetical protein NPS01_41320 [Nocardioides psychrotolerans]|uniref:Uncharacterized protein n=1 Tax=Nocardioides psychrotolerans TaxID=1005945 RepID=A0A1I3N3H1_9ACTN|nr:hypothetical protein [Nocardioides psychrotolerans]GEP40469.1 hypothetical protein NPS01_41320 [Nocardioides psychrotolerans]SFJ03741.1 hypothetical protein SAMN05216561_1174 [Nocardioides psychrotolerans]
MNYVISDIADFSVQQDLDNTSGNGINYRNAAGTALQWSDGNRAENVAVYGFAGNCWHLPGGMVPGPIVNCRGMYGSGAGLFMQMAPNGSISDIDNFSSDAQGNGAIWIKGAGGLNVGVVKIQSLKYECNANPYRTGTGAGAGEYAITLESMGGARVDVDGADVIAAGSETTLPAGVIQIPAGSQTPVLTGRNAVVRLKAGQTGTPVLLRDFNWNSAKPIANGVNEFCHTSGGVAYGTWVTNTTSGNLREIMGYNEWVGGGLGSENPGRLLVGDLPTYAMHNFLPAADRRHVAWELRPDGRVVWRNYKDNGTARDILSMRPGATLPDDRMSFDVPVGIADRQAPIGPRMTVGTYYTQPFVNNSASFGPVLDQVYFVPFPIARDCTMDRIGIYITAAAGASGVVCLGLYADDGLGKPGALLADGGTVVATSATTARSVTIGQVVTKGVYHVAVVGQVNVGLTLPTGQRANPLIGSTDLAIAAQGNARAFVQAGVSGALPSTATPGDPSSASFGNREYIVVLRASA